jgi:hypothetical protein
MNEAVAVFIGFVVVCVVGGTIWICAAEQAAYDKANPGHREEAAERARIEKYNNPIVNRYLLEQSLKQR